MTTDVPRESVVDQTTHCCSPLRPSSEIWLYSLQWLRTLAHIPMVSDDQLVSEKDVVRTPKLQARTQANVVHIYRQRQDGVWTLASTEDSARKVQEDRQGGYHTAVQASMRSSSDVRLLLTPVAKSLVLMQALTVKPALRQTYTVSVLSSSKAEAISQRLKAGSHNPSIHRSKTLHMHLSVRASARPGDYIA